MFQIEEELKKLPANPGVYLMHDERDEIIYVGKAISPIVLSVQCLLQNSQIVFHHGKIRCSICNFF